MDKRQLTLNELIQEGCCYEVMLELKWLERLGFTVRLWFDRGTPVLEVRGRSN